MRSAKTTAAVSAIAAVVLGSGGCSSSGGFPSGSGSLNPSCNSGSSFSAPASTNVMSVTVNGSLCSGGNQYVNEPCVSVTICTPGCDNQCQTINDILLDTGSYGLRVFSSVLTIPLGQVTSSGNAVAECVGFGDGSSEWGPVELADMYLAGEPIAKGVPIMVINSNYSSPPSACSTSQSTPDTDPSEAGFNGILGVGVFPQDCGGGCTSDSSNGMYFTCVNGSGCSGAAVPLSSQVPNPITYLSKDNNGAILELPSVPNGGEASVSGSLILGIGTESNNSTSGVTAYPADDNGNFRTTFNGSLMDESFIDSGSSILFFNGPGTLLTCSGNNSSFYCPTSTLTFSGGSAATIAGTSGSPSIGETFTIENANNYLPQNGDPSNWVYSTLGGPGDSSSFDWGLPFFFGKHVFVGIDGTSSSLSSGPYWAF